MILKLIHPTLGLCAQYSCLNRKSEFDTRKRWKQTYGRKFNECVIVIEGGVKFKRKVSKPVIHIPDGEIYDTVTLAATAYGVSFALVKTHCQKQLTGGFTPYRFRWA